MTKVAQTQEELQVQLEDQLKLLELFADSYDAGNNVVAKSIATSVRVLLHDTSRSHSLLGQLGMKSRRFYDTSLDHKNAIIAQGVRLGSFCGLVGIHIGSGHTLVPYLDEAPDQAYGYVNFDEYWGRVIFIDTKGNEFTREDIVLAVANEDGGAHVGKVIDEKYRRLARENALGWKVSADGKNWKGLHGAELAAVRQIGHELLRTLVLGYPHRKMVTSGSGYILAGASVFASKDSLDRGPKLGRNEKCHCGSGLKYKKCHGR